MFKGLPLFYEKGQAGETPHSAEFLFSSKTIPNFLRRENTYHGLPYFSAYKTEAFPVQNNPKNLDPSHKTDLDL